MAGKVKEPEAAYQVTHRGLLNEPAYRDARLSEGLKQSRAHLESLLLRHRERGEGPDEGTLLAAASHLLQSAAGAPSRDQGPLVQAAIRCEELALRLRGQALPGAAASLQAQQEEARARLQALLSLCEGPAEREVVLRVMARAGGGGREQDVIIGRSADYRTFVEEAKTPGVVTPSPGLGGGDTPPPVQPAFSEPKDEGQEEATRVEAKLRMIEQLRKELWGR